MSDAIAAAIAAAASAPATVDMAQVQLPLASGRPMVVALPKDFTDAEAVQAVGALLAAMGRIRAQFPPQPAALARIVGPDGSRLA